jgi:hypothetical protein
MVTKNIFIVPKTIQIRLPYRLSRRFYVVISIENKRTGKLKYCSTKIVFDTNNVEEKIVLLDGIVK